jgi:hypothetical protein
LPTDDGFEDREGHQAPFTLPISDFGFRIFDCRGSTIDRAENARQKLSGSLLDRFDHGVEVRPVAGVELGMEQFSIGTDFESAAARRNEGERLNALAQFENFGRQTDGLRRVVSNDAVFDRHFGFHFELLSGIMVRSQRDVVKMLKGVR